ncbi:MAG: translocation/assembly module TamB domain-containing protein [Zoogloeaceae bacterium]|jgi:translocation and assembly module TamB|nr:translocation/assembly module TamB domain-containing protein [Zoogloeaceae bacterium]
METTLSPDAARPAGPTPPAAPVPRRRLWRVLRWIVAGFGLLVCLCASFFAWLLMTQSGFTAGADFLCRNLPGCLRIVPQGRLIGPFALEVAWRGEVAGAFHLETDWYPSALWEGRLDIAYLRFREGTEQEPGFFLDLRGHDADSEAPRLPESLRLPFAIRIQTLEAPRMRFQTGDGENDALRLRDFKASLESDGETHRLHSLAFAGHGLRVRGVGTLGGQTPLPLAARLEVQGEAATQPVRLVLETQGPLARLPLTGKLEGGGSRGTVHLVLAPFAAEPVTDIALHLENLDPSQWLSSLPRARLEIDATFQKTAEDGQDKVSRLFIPSSPKGERGKLFISLPETQAPMHLPRKDTAKAIGISGSFRIVNHAPARLDQNGVPVRELDGRLRWQDGRLWLDALAARFASRGNRGGGGQFAGTVAFSPANGDASPTGAAAEQLTVQGRVRGLDPAAFLDSLPEGDLNGTFRLGLAEIARMDSGLALVLSLAESRLARQDFKAEGHLRLAGARLSDVDLALHTGENQLRLKGNLGRADDALQVEIAAARLERLTALAALLPTARDTEKATEGEKIAGDLHASLRLRGALRAPGISGTAQSRRLALPGDVRIQDLALSADLGTHPDAPFAATLEIARLEFSGQRLDQNRLFLEGQRKAHTLALETRTRLPELGMARLALHADGALRDADWQGELRALTLALPGSAPLLELAEPMRLTLGADRLQLENARLAGVLPGKTQGGAWQAEILHLRLREEEIAGVIEARMAEISGLSGFLGEDVQIGGRMTAALTLAGTPQAPRLAGRMTGEALHLRLLATGMRLESGRIVLSFADEQLTLEQFTFAAPHAALPQRLDAAQRAALESLRQTPGRLEGSGTLKRRERTAQGPEIIDGQLDFRLERLGVLQGVDQWIALSGPGRLRLHEGNALLEARFTVDGGYWRLVDLGAPRLSDDVHIRPADGAPLPGKTSSGFTTHLKLGVDLGDAFYFSGAGVESRLRGSLDLTGENRDSLRAVGSIRTEEGRFDAYGQELAIEQGILTFNGLLHNPGLNIRAMRRAQAVEAGVSILGTAQKPVIRLVSDPEVPDAEKLSWLLFGKGQEEGAGGIDNSALLAAANAILGGQEGGPGSLLADLQRALGVRVNVRSGSVGGPSGPGATSRVASASGFGGGAQGASGQVLQVGAKIADKLTLSYEQSLTGMESVIRLTYALSRRLSLVGQAGTENALDVFYNFTFGR